MSLTLPYATWKIHVIKMVSVRLALKLTHAVYCCSTYYDPLVQLPLRSWFTVGALWIAAASETGPPRQTLAPLCRALSHTSSCLPLSAEDGLGPGLVTVDLTDTSERCLSASILSKVVNLLSSLLSSVTDALISYANLRTVCQLWYCRSKMPRTRKCIRILQCLLNKLNIGRLCSGN